MKRALHWLRYLMALGFEEAVLLETAADLPLRRNLSLAILPNGSTKIRWS